MAGNPDIPRCNECHHECHCDELVCVVPLGVGLTDKTSPCGCKECKCEDITEWVK